MQQSNQKDFSFLFGHYMINLKEFFENFKTFKEDDDGDFEKLRVVFGTPTAAYRFIFGKESELKKKADLPCLNFHFTDSRRMFEMENPFVRIAIKKDHVTQLNQYNRETTYTPVTYCPQHWEITVSCSVWTSSYRSRDDLMSKIFLAFHGGDLYLPFHPNGDETDTYWQWVRIDESMNDESDIEGLDEKNPRKYIRTGFTMKTQGILPYYTKYVPSIKSIQINLDDEFTRYDVTNDKEPFSFVLNEESL